MTAQIVVYKAESKGISQLAVLNTLYHQRLKEVGSPCDNEINSTRVFIRTQSKNPSYITNLPVRYIQ